MKHGLEKNRTYKPSEEQNILLFNNAQFQELSHLVKALNIQNCLVNLKVQWKGLAKQVHLQKQDYSSKPLLHPC